MWIDLTWPDTEGQCDTWECPIHWSRPRSPHSWGRRRKRRNIIKEEEVLQMWWSSPKSKHAFMHFPSQFLQVAPVTTMITILPPLYPKHTPAGRVLLYTTQFEATLLSNFVLLDVPPFWCWTSTVLIAVCAELFQTWLWLGLCDLSSSV